MISNRVPLIGSLLAALGLFPGCAQGPQLAPTAPKDYYVHATPERLWNALLLVYTDLNIPIANMDRASWFMRSAEFKLASSDASPNFDCGTYMGSQLAGNIDVVVQVTTLLRPSGDSTAVRLTVQARGWSQSDADLQAEGNIFAGNPSKECVSNGGLERTIVALIAQHT